MTGTELRCECGNRIDHPDETQCDWCLSGECEILVEIEGVAGGERIGTCVADGRPVFRSRMAGTIYHTTEDR